MLAKGKSIRSGRSLTLEQLQARLNYNSETGIFTWLPGQTRPRIKKESAGTKNDGYIKIQISKAKYILNSSRLAWLYFYKKWPDKQIDHIDGNRENNAIKNLREATPQQNSQNRKRKKTASSKYKGMLWHKRLKKWQPMIVVNKKIIYLGLFKNEEEAAEAHRLAAEKYHGEYAYHRGQRGK